jgi:hypothetical protein
MNARIQTRLAPRAETSPPEYLKLTINITIAYKQ